MKKKIALLICVVFLLASAIFIKDYIGFFSNNGDYKNVYNCAVNGSFVDIGDSGGTGEDHCKQYPPVMLFLISFFTGKEIYFKYLLLVIFVVITPMVLFKITGEPISTWFYFSASNYFYSLITASYFAQGLGMTLVFSMYFLRWWQRILLLPFLIIIHSTSFLFGVGFLLLLLLQELFVKEKYWEKIQKELPRVVAATGCSPIWGTKGAPIEEVSDTVVRTSTSDAYGLISWNTIASFLFKRAPFPFLYFACKELWRRRELALLFLIPFFVFVAFTYHERALYFVVFPLVCGLSWYYARATKKMRVGLLLLSGAYLLFHLQQLYALAYYC